MGYISAGTAEEKIDFFEKRQSERRLKRGSASPHPHTGVEQQIVLEYVYQLTSRCPGTQVPVPEFVMQKRFPAAGESFLHIALIISDLSGRMVQS